MWHTHTQWNATQPKKKKKKKFSHCDNRDGPKEYNAQ